MTFEDWLERLCLIVVLVIIGLALFALNAGGQPFPPANLFVSSQSIGLFVSPVGAGISCTSSAPCAISQIAAAAKPGDTWILTNGTYTTGIQINCNAESTNGTPAAPIIVKAENERQAFLNTNGDYGIKVLQCAYWVFQGLHIRQGDNASKAEDVIALLGSGAHHVTLRRNLIEKPNRLGITSGWSAILVYSGSNSHLIEENEIYGCWANCVNLHGSYNDEVRRNYCNNAINWDAGLNNPAACFVIYPGDNQLIENNICEAVDACLDIEPSSDVNANKLLGNIAFNVKRNVIADRQTGTYALNTVIENDILLVGAGSPYNTWAFGNTRNTTITNATWNNLNGGTSPNAGANFFGDGGASFGLTNALIENYSATYGAVVSGQAAWSMNYIQFYNNSINVSPANGHVTNSKTAAPTNLGGCVVFVPAGSNLKGAGLNGADIGANVLYAYEGGKLTKKPLWSGSTKKWQFAGAVVPGVNDNGLANIETRLHPNCTSWPY